MGKHIIALKQDESRAMRWLLRARADGDGPKPALEGIMKLGKRLICVDGFRGHSMPVPEDMKELPDGTYDTLTRLHPDDLAIVIEESGFPPPKALPDTGPNAEN